MDSIYEGGIGQQCEEGSQVVRPGRQIAGRPAQAHGSQFTERWDILKIELAAKEQAEAVGTFGREHWAYGVTDLEQTKQVDHTFRERRATRHHASPEHAAGVFKGLIRLASTLQVSVHFDKISAVDRHLDDEDAVREPPETIQLHGTGDVSANTANPSWVRVVPG